jgi:NAD(P)-dependent dehydrogenase (short-subunit alcohol dehydrogenase family)
VSTPRFARAAVIGASGGIGAALAARLAEEGAAVHALSRRGAAADERLRSARIDVEDEASVARAAEAVAAEGPLTLAIVASGLLHDAGIVPEKAFRQIESATMARYFAVNAIGPALVAKHFLPRMERGGRPVFAVLSARVGSIGDNRLGGWYGYRASKAALNMIVRTLAIELARTRPGTICVALHPGTVDTPLSRPFQRNVPEGRLFNADESAARLLDVLAGLEPGDSGGCFAWDGQRIAP